MATKLVFVIGAVLLAGSAILGVINRGMYIDKRDARIEKQDQVSAKKRVLQKTEDDLQDAESTLSDRKTERDKAQANLSNAKDELESKERKLKDLEEELAKSKAELEKWAPVIKEVAGTDIAGLEAKVESLKQDIVDKQAELQGLEDQVSGANRTVEANDGRIDGLVDNQRKRKEAIAENAYEATIQAVNPDWGFVIIEGGKNRNVKSDKPLLVMTGGQRVALLTIVSVENTVTVANVVEDSVSKGMTVQPGQRVIYENTGP
jgi:predicted RNase H-like nuclease (RuvC/YqgF family)